jgi:hypothetical protein
MGIFSWRPEATAERLLAQEYGVGRSVSFPLSTHPNQPCRGEIVVKSQEDSKGISETRHQVQFVQLMREQTTVAMKHPADRFPATHSQIHTK